jgi:hypothetical protein
MGRHHRYTKHNRIEFDFSWLKPRFDLRWIITFALLGTVGLYEASTWKSCSNNIEYHYYKDLRVSEHPACTHESETFRHRPVFAQECEDALRSTNSDILQDYKWQCWWSSQPISFGKWETMLLLSTLGYVSMRMYADYHRRLEERRIQTKESRRTLEFLHSGAMQLPRFEWPERISYKKRHSRSTGVHIEPYFDSD